MTEPVCALCGWVGGQILHWGIYGVEGDVCATCIKEIAEDVEAELTNQDQGTGI